MTHKRLEESPRGWAGHPFRPSRVRLEEKAEKVATSTPKWRTPAGGQKCSNSSSFAIRNRLELKEAAKRQTVPKSTPRTGKLAGKQKCSKSSLFAIRNRLELKEAAKRQTVAKSTPIAGRQK
mgnify:CR=1 FL=1